MKPSFVTPLIEKVCRDMGITVHMEPQGYVGMLVRPDGKVRYFRGPSFDLNTLGATEVARDKDYAAYFLRRAGYPVPEGRAFFTNRWARVLGSENTPLAAHAYARSLGWPVIVKPNSKSRGVGVWRVQNKQQLLRAIRSFEAFENVFLVQRVVPGRDYRIVVLDEEVISAYERMPLSVVGDGTASVEELLTRKQEAFVREGRDTTIPIDDPRIDATLREAGYSRTSTIPDGNRIDLLPNANLSTGGDSLDITEVLHESWRQLVTRIAKDMNLRYIGIDILAEEPLSKPAAKYVVLEVNAAAGLDNYAAIGAPQRKRIETMYRKVVEAMLQ